ncbi:pectinesterase-like [Phoenix dactylifera]|uniref:Pectinesterase n=1 Tax=Phoenix dactylifera TaxID=42345 RepID=A0A8B7CBJ9_PHODC|nr:pectinesterase-like [Phoenix dactylifera]
MLTLNKRAKLLFAILSILTLPLLLLILPIERKSSAIGRRQNHLHIRSDLQVASRHCDGTLYPDLCVSTLADIPNLSSKPLPDVIAAVVNRTAAAVRSSASNCTSYLHRRGHMDFRQRLALNDCLELFDQTLDDLRTAIADLAGCNSSAHVSDLQTVLSAAITNQYTCLDGFAYVNGGGVRPSIEGRLYHVSHLVSNSLAMVKKIRRQRRGREAFEEYGRMSGGFPTWVTRKDRRLLQAAANATSPDLVVAKDGSGNFTTIGEAVAAAPNNSATRFVIYIKAGAYFENVDVAKNKKNLMFIGDGIGKTVVKASRNVVDGWTTFRSATVAVVGDGFLARDITIENSAGPSKHQAVALRVGADLSAFYRCSFVAYQDTLYVHSLRQFYRDCDVYGTVDFIFGNAAVVLQSCNLYARKPDPNQKNIFTAQGREDPNQNTGISIQKCKVAAASDLIPVQSNFSTYLGRPWKQYSRTVFMQSFLGSLIDPAGWLEWDGDFALSTLYYGEYMNQGPGSNTSRRVTWPGYRVITSAAEASNFTVASFIQGDQWLGATSVPFTSGL